MTCDRGGMRLLDELPTIEAHVTACDNEPCSLVGLRDLMADMVADKAAREQIPLARIAAVAELIRPYADGQGGWLAATAVLQGKWLQELLAEHRQEVIAGA